MAYSIIGNFDEALEFAVQALDFNQSRNDIFNTMQTYYTLTSAAFGKGDYEVAQTYSLQMLKMAKGLEQSWFQAYAHIDLGRIARALGDHEGQHVTIS